MSVRSLTYRLLGTLWRGLNQVEGKNQEHVKRVVKNLEIEGPNVTKQSGGCRGARVRARRESSAVVPQVSAASSTRTFNFSSARRVLVDNVLKRVTNSQAAILRRRAAHQLTCLGNSAPFLALVGVSLASGSGIITKEDEIESVCYEIRQTVSKTRLIHAPPTEDDDVDDVGTKEDDRRRRQTADDDHVMCLADFDLGRPIAKGCSAVVYSAKLASDDNVTKNVDGDVTKNVDDVIVVPGPSSDEASSSKQFPLAVKMMFNYDAESNAFSILRAMHRETVPARNIKVAADVDPLYKSLDINKVRVPPHPNIVDMVTVFTDQVPGLPGDLQLYGDALPARLNPSGCGRNMSLFLVMKRYDCSLKEYLEKYKNDISPRTSLILLTQLLEGVAFLSECGVAHRDLKCDNLLLDLSGGPHFPQLVITDFGCCLADSHHGLRLPYRTYDTDKGGNAALMAPEVALARPGAFVNIRYDKSDLWTAGTIAYEMFGQINPFYRDKDKLLDSRTYTQADLPPMPASAPPLVSALVHSILSPSPSSRPDPRLAATLCQLVLWAPSAWIRDIRPGTQDILQWLLTMTTKVVYESRWGNAKAALFEYQLVATFLATMSLNTVRRALCWIQDNIESTEPA